MKKYLTLLVIFLSGYFLFSISAFADAGSDATAGINRFSGLITLINNTIVKSLGTLFMSLAVVAFFFGLVQYIWGLRQGDVNKSKVGNQFMGWGLVALFVMFSVYGIIKFGQDIFFNGRDVTRIGIPVINAGGTGNNGGNTTGGAGTGGNSGGLPVGGNAGAGANTTGGGGTGGNTTGGTGGGVTGEPCSENGRFGTYNSAGQCIPI